jgi:hypothetical protein
MLNLYVLPQIGKFTYATEKAAMYMLNNQLPFKFQYIPIKK